MIFRGQIKDVKFNISHENLKDKFNEITNKINTLLGKENNAKLIPVNTLENIQLLPGYSMHYKVTAKGQKIPIKIRLRILKGVPNGLLYISQRYEKPNKNRYEKKVLVSRNEVNIVFKGDIIKESVFINDFIYFTFEAEREEILSFECCFGNMYLQPIKENQRESISSQTVEVKVQEIEEEKKKPMTARNGPILSSAGTCDLAKIFITSYVPPPTARCLKTIHHHMLEAWEERIKRVSFLRDQREEEEARRKFLLIHKKYINGKHVRNLKINL